MRGLIRHDTRAARFAGACGHRSMSWCMASQRAVYLLGFNIVEHVLRSPSPISPPPDNASPSPTHWSCISLHPLDRYPFTPCSLASPTGPGAWVDQTRLGFFYRTARLFIVFILFPLRHVKPRLRTPRYPLPTIRSFPTTSYPPSLASVPQTSSCQHSSRSCSQDPALLCAQVPVRAESRNRHTVWSRKLAFDTT